MYDQSGGVPGCPACGGRQRQACPTWPWVPLWSENRWQGMLRLSALMLLALPASGLLFPLPLVVQQDVVCQVRQLPLEKAFVSWRWLDRLLVTRNLPIVRGVWAFPEGKSLYSPVMLFSKQDYPRWEDLGHCALTGGLHHWLRGFSCLWFTPDVYSLPYMLRCL